MTQLFNGGMTWDEAAALIRFLPIESAYATAKRDRLTDDQFAAAMAAAPTSYGAWSKDQMLLAALIDAVHSLTYIQMARGGVKAQPPKPVPRPGVEVKKKVDPAAVAYLEEIRERHRREAG